MDIWSNQVIKFVENTVDDLHQEMSLLVLKCRRHQQRQDLVKKGPGTKLSGLICNLTERSLQVDSWLEVMFVKV